ncbi:MAG: hypothetical protein ACTSXA_11950 [Candidatus Heimdallarchaeota archaeon]
MGLEPLFLPKYEVGKGKKLSERVSMLLTNLGYNHQTVKATIKRAYKFRNKVVHGLEKPVEQGDELKKLHPMILDYLRVSLIFFLLYHDDGRDSLANLIVDSITVDSKKKSLVRKTKKLMKKFSVCFNQDHYALQ